MLSNLLEIACYLRPTLCDKVWYHPATTSKRCLTSLLLGLSWKYSSGAWLICKSLSGVIISDGCVVLWIISATLQHLKSVHNCCWKTFCDVRRRCTGHRFMEDAPKGLWLSNEDSDSQTLSEISFVFFFASSTIRYVFMKQATSCKWKQQKCLDQKQRSYRISSIGNFRSNDWL